MDARREPCDGADVPRTNERGRNVDFLDGAAVALSLSDVFFAVDFLYLLYVDETLSRLVDASAFDAALKGRVLRRDGGVWTRRASD